MAKAKKPVVKKKATTKKSKNEKVKTAPKRKKKGEELMCFLTSACVDYYGLDDSCRELNTLRQYRDSYLVSTISGKRLVEKYYRISPPLVKKINNDPEKSSVFEYIYSVVSKACAEIDAGRLNYAQRTYEGMVKTLVLRYAK